MKMFVLPIILGTLLFSFSCTKDRSIAKTPISLEGDRIIINYWDFNNADNPLAIISPTISETNQSINFYHNGDDLPYCDGNGESCWESVNDGTLENAYFSSEAGRALRLRNPCSYLDVHCSTEGFGEIEISYAVKRTGSGAQKNRLQYSANGTNFSSLGLTENEFTVEEDFSVITANLKNVPSANNATNFVFRILFEDGNMNNSGNNRIDNLMISGKPL
jgi:hypothetical protein